MEIMPKGYVYILRSARNNKFYIGSTTDLIRRVGQHNRGKVRSTKPLGELKLEFSQEYSNINSARAIERRLKKLKRKDYL